MNGSGSLLASLVLGKATSGSSNPDGFGAQYCTFQDFSLGFSGVAKLVVFGGTVNQQVFDDLTFGSTTAGSGGNTGAVPEPSTWAMMLLGFAAVGMAMRKRANVVTSVRYA
ncbi:PEPxxWA-CTERM sorting domain-containing protein [Novosphingobium piscinae]|nr:PEPxxWA-CTERM sorting domain-containing protein [Novosphingobium piscinae]